MIKVVTPEEMRRVERLAVAKGASSKDFMLQAGTRVAATAKAHLQKSGGRNVALLTYRGNKSGDAFVAGIELLKAGFQVRAVICDTTGSYTELNRHFAAQFTGRVDADYDFSQDDLLIDGLLGTGFSGAAEGTLKKLIEAANLSGKPILAIDLPSGLDGTTGKVQGAVIQATETVTLGFPKIGLFTKEGWNCLGKLQIEPFGLSDEMVEEAIPVAYIADLKKLHLPPMIRSHHKYERGCVIGFGGSEKFKGAIKLSGSAALHTGAGIVQLFTLEDVGPVDDELIAQIWDLESWKRMLTKASAMFIGPGLGRSAKAREACKAVLHQISKPCVVDADALFFVPEVGHPKHCVLTPHRGEMLHLLGATADLDDSELWDQCQSYVEKQKLVLVLKGAPTRIFAAGELPILVVQGDPGLATAGSGDVLTGIIAALLAQGQALREAAVLGVMLHSLAGERAAAEKTSYGFTATDLIAYLPSALKRFL